MTRRNSERLEQVEQTEVPETPKEKSFSPSSPAEQTFFVSLPSKGRFYPEGHPWKDRECVELKVMTIAQQDILNNPSYKVKGVVFEKLIASMLVDNVNVDSLLQGDKEALILAARVDGYGSDYRVEMLCFACGTKQEVVFDLEEQLKKENKLKNLAEYELTENGFSTTLPQSKAKVEVRFLTEKDEKSISRIKEKARKHSLPINETAERMKLAIISVNDEGGASVEKLVSSMRFRDGQHIEKLMKALKPQVSTKAIFKCKNPECGDEREITIPFSADLFWDNS